jgi:hypothetical protein
MMAVLTLTVGINIATFVIFSRHEAGPHEVAVILMLLAAANLLALERFIESEIDYWT